MTRKERIAEAVRYINAAMTGLHPLRSGDRAAVAAHDALAAALAEIFQLEDELETVELEHLSALAAIDEAANR